MDCFVSARVIVVAGRDSGRALVQSLSRMGLSDVQTVASPQEAQSLCESYRADGCLVMLPPAIPDEVPRWSEESDAPGRAAGVPSLLIADVLTPHLLRSARNSGYFATIRTGVPPRMLYRSLRALLQRRRQSNPGAQSEGRPGSAAVGAANVRSSEAWSGKLKLQ